MAMRKKQATAAKVRNAWRCPKCGRKVATAECYGCLMEVSVRSQLTQRWSASRRGLTVKGLSIPNIEFPLGMDRGSIESLK